MYASFILAFHTARIDNLLQTLRFLEKDHANVVKKSQLILICQDFSPEIDNKFGDYKHYNLELECMQLPYVTNTGVKMSDSEVLVILESDRILPPGYFQNVIDTMQPNTMVTTEQMIRLDNPTCDKDIAVGLEMAQHLHADPTAFQKPPFDYHEEHRSTTNELGHRTCFSGNITVMKTDYQRAGGMDENYKGYGWMDNDMTNTMLKAGVQPVFRQEVELHLWHEQTSYGTVNDSNFFTRNGLYFCRKWGVEIPDWLRETIAEKSRIML